MVILPGIIRKCIGVYQTLIPPSVKQRIRKPLVDGYTFLTPYMNPEIPFPRDYDQQINSFSERREDLLIHALLHFKKRGTYVDIGANDPVTISNTKRFYNSGWTGINVEPNPHKYELIVQDRTRDVNLNAAVSDTEGIMPFYILGHDPASALDPGIAKQQASYFKTDIKEVVNIPVMRVDTILDTYLDGRHIDFMSVDVEGNELPVLKSNNWEKYRPTLLVIELRYDDTPPLIDYLGKLGYVPLFKTQENGFFIDGVAGW